MIELKTSGAYSATVVINKVRYTHMCSTLKQARRAEKALTNFRKMIDNYKTRVLDQNTSKAMFISPNLRFVIDLNDYDSINKVIEMCLSELNVEGFPKRIFKSEINTNAFFLVYNNVSKEAAFESPFCDNDNARKLGSIPVSALNVEALENYKPVDFLSNQ